MIKHSYAPSYLLSESAGTNAYKLFSPPSLAMLCMLVVQFSLLENILQLQTVKW